MISDVLMLLLLHWYLVSCSVYYLEVFIIGENAFFFAWRLSLLLPFSSPKKAGE